MGARSHVIWQISEALKEFDFNLRCASVAELKQNLPALADRELRSIEQLEELLSEIKAASVEKILTWQKKTTKQPKLKQRDLDIYELRKAGGKFAEIAKEFQISKERVRQIVARVERLKV